MKTINILIALLLIFPAVSGEIIINKHTNDFNLYSPNNEQIKLCSCETRTDTVVVENTGSFRAGFSLWIETAWPGSMELAETWFELEPGESREVPVFISDSCSVTGTYDYVVRASNSYGRDESLHRSIRSDECQIARLDVSPDVSTGVCSPAIFEVTATNVGRSAQEYTLRVDGANIPIHEMYLKPDESLTQNVTLQWDCTDYGDRTVTFNLESESRTETTQRTVSIVNEYDFTLDMPSRIEACALGTTTVQIGIDNPIHAPQRISFDMDAPPWVSISQETLEVEPYGIAYMDIELKPEIPGEHILEIEATDEYGGMEKERQATIVVDNCYDLAVELRSSPDEIFDGSDRDCCGEKTYYVNILNTGEKEQLFHLDVDGPSLFRLEDSSVRLMPSQSMNVRLFADLPCSDDTYVASIKVWPQGQEQLVVEKALTVESLTPRACYMVEINDDELELGEGPVQVKVVHTGLRAATYELSTNDSDFSFREESVYLSPGEEKTLFLESSVSEEGRYIVSPSFMQEDGIVYNEFLGVQKRGQTGFQEFNSWLSIDLSGLIWCPLTVLILVIVLVLLVIMLVMSWLGLIVPFAEGLKPGTLSLLRTLLVIGMLVLVIVLLLMPAPAREERFQRLADSNGTVLEWYEGESLSVDLDEYFQDPDGDELTYETTQPRNIRAIIDGSNLKLTPDDDFTGENEVRIRAFDHTNATMSPVFTLRVIPEKESGLMVWTRQWCGHLIVLLGLAILATLFLILLGVRERRQDLKSRNVVVVVPKNEKKRKKPRPFVSSKNSDTVHRRTCTFAKRIKRKDKVFYASSTSAKKEKLDPCDTCEPYGKKASTRKSSKTSKKKRKSPKKSTKKSSKKSKDVKKVKGKAVKKGTDVKESSNEQKNVNIQVNISQK